MLKVMAVSNQKKVTFSPVFQSFIYLKEVLSSSSSALDIQRHLDQIPRNIDLAKVVTMLKASQRESIQQVLQKYQSLFELNIRQSYFRGILRFAYPIIKSI